MLKGLLNRVIGGESLSSSEMADAIGTIMDGQGAPAQVAGLLIALRMKGETSEEIRGAAVAMRERMTRIDVTRRPLIDTCGTGGDGKGTFNISTATAFVAAAGGVAVAKHGNRAVSSRSGSADVLKSLGVNIEASAETVARCVEEVGIGFLFAPAHHPAMKHVMPVRRELGVRTIFNVLGPLTNPAGAPRQLLGVFDRRLVPVLAEVLGRLGCERAWVVHGADGLDELTVCDQTYVGEWTGTDVVEHTLTPAHYDIPLASEEGLKGGTPEENASTMREILAGERQGPIRDAVAFNAAAAFTIAGVSADLKAGVEHASELLRNGAAAAVLNRLVEVSNA